MARNEVGFKGAKLVGAVIDGAANFTTKTVTVLAGAATGTATVAAGTMIIGLYQAGNQDQFIDNVAVSGTTLTITLAANATANNVFKVTVLEG